MKTTFKKVLATLLALLMIVSVAPLQALAATYITNMDSDAQFGVISGSYDDYDHELHYAKYDGKTYITFCCEFGVKSPTGTTYKYGSDFKKYLNRSGDTYKKIAKYIAFGYTLQYGDGLPSTKAEKIAACCTQQFVWETLGVNPTRGSWNSTYMSDSLYKSWLADTNDLIDLYYNKKPSFNGSTKSLNLGASTTLTDSNNVFKYYPTFSKKVNGVTFAHTKGENKLTITVDDNCSTHSVKFNSASQGIYMGLPNGDAYDANTMNYCYFEFEKGDIQDLMFSHYVDPQTFTINADVTFGNAQLTKTSEDGIVSGIEFTVTGGGNTYTMTTNSSGVAKLSNIPCGTYTVTEKTAVRYKTPESKTITVKDGETANVSFNNVLKKGNIKIEKNSEDKLVSGFDFVVKGSDGTTYNATTNSSGVATVTNLPVYDKNNNKITYSVNEVNVPIRYYTPDGQTVKLDSDGTSPVTFNNILKKGNLRIEKDAEDKLVEGLTFAITGSNGSSYSIKTNADGIASLNDIPVYGSDNKKIVYTVKETNVPIRYVTPDNQTVSINPDTTTTLKFNNILKKFRVNVTKVDIEKTNPQGDATLAGAVYGIYKDNKLIDTYTTDKYGKFTTKYYVCDTNWTFKEITPSEGYNLDDTTYKVGADPKNFTVEYNDCSITVKEQVIKGNISIIKHTDDGSTQIETPEKGAEFQIYLKSSGSFAKAKDTEKDTIVCDEDGFASSKLLPYGVYTVHQSKGWSGRELIKDFDVFISSEGKTYKFLINNANFMSYLKVVKLDKETNKPIAYEGAAFEIYDTDGHRVSMQFTYPQVTTIHTFYTNSEGYLITPEKLPYGDYTLVEVQAPKGYVLDSTPIPFTINQENSSTDTGVTVVKVKAKDMAQKGVINITKSGEVFANITTVMNAIIDADKDEISFAESYTPQYQVENLKDAVFEIFAAEDIVTLDGTVRYEQGEKVDEITTGSNGVATSKELYLGKYTVVEKTAPNTFVNSNEQYDVELVYAGQEVSVTKTDLSVYNERQRVEVSLKKVMQENCIYGIGNNGEIFSVSFGIYADENITSSSGVSIPKDGLITIAYCDEDGNVSFDCDLPIGYKYYVKEISTDCHYILDDTKYTFNTEYQGQDTELIEIKINEGKELVNKLIYGVLHGFKFDRETKEAIKGAVFGLFRDDETEFTEDNAIVVTETDENGNFIIEDIPYGDYIISEIEPAEGYLANTDVHHIHIDHNEQEVVINKENDRIPELKTTATVDREKTVCATEVFTLTDTVEYKHLVPNNEYTITGILMDKSTGKPFIVDGNEVTSEVTFTPTEPSGTVDVLFTFDSKYIKTETNIVVFESIYKDGTELAVHADIDDEDQTVTVKIPEIKTMAEIKGKKKVTATKKITVVDTVSYTNLTVGKEYELKGVLIDKATGKPYMVDGKEIVSVVKFTPTESNGTVDVKFTFNGSGINKTTELVVFETLYRDGVELTSHTDINDKGQTVTIEAPKPKTPKTGDESDRRTLATIMSVAMLGGISALYMFFKNKKRKDNDEQ